MKAVNSRRDLKESLQVWTSDSYEDVKEEQRLEEGQTYLKSYLIESDRDTLSDDFIEKEDLNIKILPTDDEGFLHLRARGYSSDGPTDLYLDELDDRFWVVHTVGGREATDDVVEDLIFPRFTQMDRPWLPNEFLEQIGSRPENIFRRFSLKFEDEFSKGEKGETPDVGGLSMQLWGDNAGTVLQTLKENEDLRRSTPLSTVGIKREVGDEAVIDDITYYSKFTARGDSVDGHFKQVYDLKNTYSELLHKIEDEYSIKYSTSERGGHVEGTPLLIAFDREIEELEDFMDELFSSKKPFRLWGVRNQLEEDYYRISSVDLHTGDKLNLEVCPDWVRIYLPEDSCGNVVLRLYTNVQHYFDSEANLEEENGGAII
ncbi:hypothetical protein ACERIT_06840 [Halopenitus sp. H-Gu1]|uniref:hypothetical protein n=1 Tax=Halopenitus sp. H-Gu1 TaxID=3242697 RepID=UPI00359E6405